MMVQRPLIKLWMLIIFCGSFLVGFFSLASATPQFSFAGYRWLNENNAGSIAQIPYGNPSVPTGQSLEWVMSDDGTHYIQSGWIKKSSYSGPKHFVEYSCSTVCQYVYGNVASGTTHTYKVELVSSTWCAYIDGVSEQCVTTSALGMGNASYADYSGESSDTNADIGGTSSNHFHMYNLQFKRTSNNTWYQVNTNYMANLLTSGTAYYDSVGYTNPYTWVENWTAR